MSGHKTSFSIYTLSGNIYSKQDIQKLACSRLLRYINLGGNIVASFWHKLTDETPCSIFPSLLFSSGQQTSLNGGVRHVASGG